MTSIKIITFLLITLTLISCLREGSSKNPDKKSEKIANVDTSVNEIGRLLPKKLRFIPFGITANHYPNPCYADFEDGKYVWKHNTTISANRDLQIVEYGSFVYTKKGWYLRVTNDAKFFDEHYGTKDGQLRSGVIYSDPASWRRSDSLFAGDAMWYYIAKDKSGNLFKGIAPIETEGKLLKEMEFKKGYSKFSTTASKIAWTGYGEIGNYSLSGDLKLKSGIYLVNNDTIKNAEFVFDMTTINSGEKNLVDHLKGEDFFDVNKYPTAEFVLTQPILLKNKKLFAFGILTIKGISQNISFPLSFLLQNNKVNIAGKLSFDRTTFNIKYNSKSFFSNLGDQAIKNNIDLSFSMIAE
jgi:polyisoprenoid-binding protein YceI